MIKNIFVNKTNFLAFSDMLESVCEDEKNIIIVPDKFSLSSEQLFLEKRVVSFSTQIFSLTKFASMVLKENLDGKKVIDKNISIMLISCIIKENQQSFRHFKSIKSVAEFSADVFKFISQIESSGVQDFNENLSKELKDKLFDLNLIYEKYREKQKDFLIDAGKKYDLFVKEIKNSEIVGKSNFFFGMFTNLTAQEKKIVKEIAKFAKSVSFSASKSENRINNNEIFEFYSSLGKNVSVFEKNSLNDYNNFIISTFFDKKKAKFELLNDEIKIFEAKDIEEEVDNLVFEIRKDIFVDNLRFKDLAICVNGLERYEKLICEKFDKASFSYFLDIDEKLINTSYARFVLNFFDALKDFKVENILKILKSGYLTIDEKIVFEFENFAREFVIDNIFCDVHFLKEKENFASFEYVRDFVAKKIRNFAQESAKTQKTSQFFESLAKIFEEFSVNERLQEKIDNLKEKDILKFKRLSQVQSKVQECFDDVSSFCENFNLIDVRFFVELCFENVMISLPSSSCDEIFVGDCLKSIYKNYEKVYVLGADSSFPSLVRDDALLSDDELKQIEKDAEIEPKSTKTNKINYYKAFENLLSSNKNLVLSYFVKNRSGVNFPSISIKNFLEHFLVNSTPIKMTKISGDVLEALDYNDILNVLSLKFGSKKDFVKSFYLSKPSKAKDVMQKFILDRTNWKIDEEKEEIDKNVIHIKNYSSSSVEDYFACPRKYFLKDVLKISKPNECLFDGRIVGLIVHDCLKKIAGFMGKRQEIDRKTKEKIVFDVLNSDEISFLKQNRTNKQLFENLTNEILRLFDFVIENQKTSEFVLKKAEYRFEKVYNGFLLKGFVDRIDETENEFVVIDYKTGNTKIDYADIVLGKKVQLLLYAKVLEEILSKKCVGVFYLTINDDYSTKEQNNIFYNGILIDNELIRKKLIGENEKFFELKEKYLLSENQFDKLKNYVFEKVMTAIKNIQKENFCEFPTSYDGKTSCDYCDFKDICLFVRPNCLEYDDEMIKEILDD